MEKRDAAVPGTRASIPASPPKRPQQVADTSAFDSALLILHSSADTIERSRALRNASQVLKVQATSFRAQLAVLPNAVAPRSPGELDELGEFLKDFEAFLLALEGYSRDHPAAGVVDDVASTGITMLKALDELLDAWATNEPVEIKIDGSQPPPLPDLLPQASSRRPAPRVPPPSRFVKFANKNP